MLLTIYLLLIERDDLNAIGQDAHTPRLHLEPLARLAVGIFLLVTHHTTFNQNAHAFLI